MRLQPIKNPRGLKARLAYWMSKRQLGKTITPLSAVFARVPQSLNMSYQISKFLRSDLALDPGLRLLVQSSTAQANRCAFCVDIAQAFAAQDEALLEKCRHVADFETDARFSESERAALRYAHEASENGTVEDETFAALRRHFTEREIVEITLINAIEHFFNRVNLPLEIESDGLCAIALSRQGRKPEAAQIS